MIRKRVLPIVLLLLLLLTPAVRAADSVKAYLFPVAFVINHQTKPLQPGYSTFEYNNRLYIPVRFVSEGLGARVRYDATSRKVVIEDSHVFDARYVNPGDRIAGMEVAEVDLTRFESESLGSVRFRGSALVKGSYLYSRNDPLSGEMLRFYVDEDASDRLPVMSHDNRDPGFVFENPADAVRLLGIPEDADTATGRAAVVIDDYVIRYDYKEVHNTARLVEAYVQAK